MRGSPIVLNLVFVFLTLVIPRIPPGGELYGDPILQILYLVLFLPVMAVLLNLIFAKQGKNRWPLITTNLVCLLASVAAYTKWIISTNQMFLHTDSEQTFVFLFLASVGLASALFGILRITGSGRIAKTVEISD